MILEYAGVLQILAEVSVALAGFIGVILVVQHSGRTRWSQGEKNTLFHLLFSSLGVLGLSLLPLLIQPAFTDSVPIWRICCPVMAFFHVYGPYRGIKQYRRQEISMPKFSAFVFPAGSILIAGLAVAIALGFLLDHAAIVYFAGLGWLLGVAIFAFVNLLFRSIDSASSAGNSDLED